MIGVAILKMAPGVMSFATPFGENGESGMTSLDAFPLDRCQNAGAIV